MTGAPSRVRALKAAADRLMRGAEWLRANPGHPDESRARRRLGELVGWARGAVLTAGPEVSRDEDFVRIARLLFPCPRCGGRGTKYHGPCFKCGGSGYHATREKK